MPHTSPSPAFLRALIVEDSRSDLLNLRTLLASYPDVRIVAEAETLSQARECVAKHEADLVFLDIELGHESGIDLIPSLKPDMRVIFTTVHRNFGVEAFDLGILDYLVKPLGEERLLRALRRVEKLAGDPLARRFSTIPVYRGGSSRSLVPMDSISAVLADGDYSRVLTGTLDLADHRRFRDWVQLLAEREFSRLDRSTLVNLAEVETWQPYGRGAIIVLRGSKIRIELGRTAFQRLTQLHQGILGGNS